MYFSLEIFFQLQKGCAVHALVIIRQNDTQISYTSICNCLRPMAIISYMNMLHEQDILNNPQTY